MAVVSRVSRVRAIMPTGDYREWTATAATQDAAAGSGVVVTVAQTTSGTLPPDEPNIDVELNFYVDNGSTLVKSVTFNPSTLGSNTFFFTANGLTGGAARLGTVRMRLRVEKTNGGPTATYHLDSDGTNSTTLAAGSSQLDRGWVRGTAEISAVSLSNLVLGGGKLEPAQYQDNLYVRATVSAQSYAAYTTTLAIGGSSKTASVSGSGTTRDATFSGQNITTGRVNEGFPATQDTYLAGATVGSNSALTGQPWTVFTATSVDSLLVDPRVWAVHLFQLDDNSFGSPPLSKLADSNERPSSSIGYFATGFYAARGGVVGDVMTEGINGITATFTLTAQSNGAEISRVATTGTEGGEDGWTAGFMQWTSPLPGGQWLKVADITSPGDIDLDNYLLNAQSEYILLAARSPYDKVKAGGGNASAPGRHFTPGDPLAIFAGMWNTKDDTNGRQYIAADAESVPVAIFTRPNTATLTVEYLDATYTWQADPGGSLYAHPLTQSPNDSRLWVLSIPGSGTADWGAGDLDVECNGFKLLGVAYDTDFQLTVVDSHNQHDVDPSESASIVRQVLDGGAPLTEGRHATYGDPVRVILLPQRAGVLVSEAGMVRELAVRNVNTSQGIRRDWWWDKPGGADWVNFDDGAHPTGGQLIYSSTPDVVTPPGAGFWDLPGSLTAALEGVGSAFTASARVTFDAGLTTERVRHQSSQVEVLGAANAHNGYEFDPIGLFK